MTTVQPPIQTAPLAPPPPPPPAPPAPVAKGSNGLAVAGFVLGLLGFLGSFIPVINIGGIVVGVLGVILAAVGLAKSKKVRAGKGLSIAGVVLGVLALVMGIVMNVAFYNAVDNAVDEVTNTSVEPPASSGDEDVVDVDDAVGTTRDNPAPLGSAVTGGDWTVTVNSVRTADADSYGDTASVGKTLLEVNLTATYNGDDAQGDSVWATVSYVGADGNTVDSTDGFFIPENQFDSLKTVHSGGSVTGNEMFEVPDDWQDGVLSVTPEVLSDATFVAVQ